MRSGEVQKGFQFSRRASALLTSDIWKQLPDAHRLPWLAWHTILIYLILIQWSELLTDCLMLPSRERQRLTETKRFQVTPFQLPLCFSLPREVQVSKAEVTLWRCCGWRNLHILQANIPTRMSKLPEKSFWVCVNSWEWLSITNTNSY